MRQVIDTANVVRLLLVLVLTLSGCTPSAARGAGERSGPETTYDLDQVTQMSAALDDRLYRHVEACMASRGFPQLEEARRLAVTRPTAGAREALVFDPLEAGPYTRDQAQRYGVLGTADLFDGGEPGHVISKSADFDGAQAGCRDAFAGGRGEDAEAVLGEFAELQNAMRRSLLERSESDIEAVLSQRLDCVRRNGYGTLSTDTRQPVRDQLKSAGVTPGQHAFSPPVESEVEAGTVRVFAPADRPEYLPSVSERAFALVYVQCGEEQGFVSAWEDAQSEHRRAVLADNEGGIDGVGATLEALLEVASETSRPRQP